jgi:hypothetical protein
MSTLDTPEGRARARARETLEDPIEAKLMAVGVPPRRFKRLLGPSDDARRESYTVVSATAPHTVATYILQRRLAAIVKCMSTLLLPFVVGLIAVDQAGHPMASVSGIFARMGRGEYATFARGGEARVQQHLAEAYAAAEAAAPMELRRYIAAHGRVACASMATLALEEAEMVEEEMRRRA